MNYLLFYSIIFGHIFRKLSYSILQQICIFLRKEFFLVFFTVKVEINVPDKEQYFVNTTDERNVTIFCRLEKNNLLFIFMAFLFINSESFDWLLPSLSITILVRI